MKTTWAMFFARYKKHGVSYFVSCEGDGRRLFHDYLQPDADQQLYSLAGNVGCCFQNVEPDGVR
jgi:hypothetical protein